MYQALLDRTLESLASIRAHLGTSEVLRAAIFDGVLRCRGDSPCFDQAILTDAPDKTEWRIIDHCSAVTRTYAVLESFVFQLIREHLMLIQRHYKFSELSDSVRGVYTKGISRIIERKEGNRFRHLDLRSLVLQFKNALSETNYELEPLAFFQNEANLRLGEINKIFSGVGIDNASVWLEKSSHTKDFFASEDRMAGTVEAELSQLIQYRNDAAHGGLIVDDVLGTEVLLEYCDFFSCICRGLAEHTCRSGLSLLIAKNAAHERGNITSILKNGSVIIGTLNGFYRIDDIIYLCGPSTCVECRIVSIRLNDEDFNEIELLETKELGLGLDRVVRRADTIVTISNNIPWHLQET